jgi:hypothetical protein
VARGTLRYCVAALRSSKILEKAFEIKHFEVRPEVNQNYEIDIFHAE